MALENNKMQTSQTLRDMLQQRQNGLYNLQPEEVPTVSTTQQPAVQAPTPSLYRQTMIDFKPSIGVSQSYIDEALKSGYGTSQYDNGYYPGMDLENARALEQSGFAKIGTGLLKGGVIAATTAVNTTVGTVSGALSGINAIADGEGFMGVVDSAVNNPVSQWLVDLQRKSEEWFPNYRTEEERSEKYQKEWYKHMLTPNFIGDSLLKNFGFTVGAMGGGLVWTKSIGAILSKRLANNILKGAVAASAGDAEANASMQEAIALLKKKAAEAGTKEALAASEAATTALENGTAVGVNAEKLIENVKNAAKSIGKMDAKMQLYGSVLGAMGEGTVEGLMAKQEFLEDMKPKLERQFAREYDSLEQRILDTGNKDWVDVQLHQTPDGLFYSTPVLTEKGQKHLQYLQNQLTDEYDKRREYMDEQAERLASTTFLLNLPILTTSNAIQFGRMFSGGWKTNRAKFSGIQGNAKKAGTAAAAEGSAYARPKFSAEYTYNGKVAPKALWNTMKVMGSESFEEMSQGTVSSGAKNVASRRISSFNDTGYDPESTNAVRDWFVGMYEGGADYLTDIKNWQEGALGALTGLFGIPGRRWNGGLVGVIRDAKEEVNDAKTAADKLSNLVNSEDFQNRWHGYIRHMKYDNDMEKALAKDDEYAWHTADDEQLINDVITFADAGKLDDLSDIVKTFGNITASDAERLRDDMLREKDSSLDWAKNKTGEEVAKKIKDQADKMQKTVQDYKDIYEALSARAPIGADPNFIKEQVFTAMQVKAMDARFLQMFGETMEALDPLLIAMSATTEDGKAMPAKEAGERYKALKANFEQIFAGSLLPSFSIKEIMKEAADMSYLDEITKTQDPELNKKLNDMKRLADDRNMFFLKLQTLQKPKAQEEFKDKAVTPDKVAEAAEKDISNLDTEGLKTVADVRKAYFFDGDAPRGMQSRVDFARSLRSISDKNPAAKEFLKIREKVQELETYANNNMAAFIAAANDSSVRPSMVINAIRGIMDVADSEQDVLDVEDKMFESEEDFLARSSNSISFDNGMNLGPRKSTPERPGTFQSVKNVVRNIVADYARQNSDTASRKTITPKPNPVTPAPAGTAQTEGSYDAAAPGSQLPPPTPAAQKKPETPAAPAPQAAPETPSAVKNNPVAEDTITVADIIDLYEYGAKDTEEAGKEGFSDVVQAIRDANPEVSGNKSAEEQKAAIANMMAVAQKYPELELSKRILGTYAQVANPALSASEEAGENASIIREFTKEEKEEQREQDLPNMQDEDDVEAELDAVISEEEDEDEGEEAAFVPVSGQGDVIPYYRMSIPEIATGEAKKARRAARRRSGDFRAADLSDFVTFEKDATGKWIPKKNAQYAKLYHSLKEAGAFDTVANELKRGDKIEFVISPDDKWKLGNTPQILVTTVKNGQRKVLSILSQQTDKYYNLSALRDAIMSEYREFSMDHPNDEFVFSKQSEVWTKRPGLIDYGTQVEEKGIEDISGYDGNAPIVFIQPRNGKGVDKGMPMLVRGADSAALSKMRGTFNDAESNKRLDGKTRKSRLGRLYYLAKNGDDSYIPIRLNVEHFNHKTKNLNNPTFQRIRDIAQEMSNLVKQAYVRPNAGGVEESNIDELNQKLWDLQNELNDILDMRHNTYMEIRNFKNIGIGLKYIPNMQEEGKRTELIRKPDQISGTWLVNEWADLDKSLSLKEDEHGKIRHLDDYIKQGLITSNARMLRAKGADFYMLPWRTDMSDFGPANPSQFNAASEQAEARGEDLGQFHSPHDIRPESEDFFGEDDMDTIDEETDIPDDFSSDMEDEAVLDIDIEPDADYQQKAREQYLSRVREVMRPNDDKMRNATPAQLAKTAITLASQGSTRLKKVLDVISVMRDGNNNLTMQQSIQGFADMINMMLSKNEREAAGRILAGYQKVQSPKDVDMYVLMLDYNKWLFNPSEISNSDVAKIFSLFKSVEDNARVIYDSLPVTASMIGNDDDRYGAAASDFGVVKDISKFENLPSSIKEQLKAQGKDGDYDNLTEAERDKRLLCL